MGKIKTLIKTYQREGFKPTINKIKKHFLTGPGGQYTKKILGKRYHQKLYIYDRLGYWPRIKNPRTFNEKILHRKLYTDNELFSVVEDKWRVREYVAEKVGESILPKVYHVTDDPDTIPFDELPGAYVIKPNHLSGGANFIIDEESNVDIEQIKKQCSKWLDKTYGRMKEEYWYSKISPKIMVEEYIKSEQYQAPIDYKFMTFHGKVKVIHATYNRFDETATKRNFYDKNWNPIDVKLHFEQGEDISKPPNLNEMIDIAERLGEDFEHIRVDLYNPDDSNIYFGEMTVAESSGGNPFVPQEYDFKFGSYW